MTHLPTFRSATGLCIALCTLTGAAVTYSGGVQSGSSGVPANASRAVTSCAACHSGSAPTSVTWTRGPSRGSPRTNAGTSTPGRRR